MKKSNPDAELQAAQREFMRMADDLEKYSVDALTCQAGRRPYCSFCGRAKAEVKAMIQGVNASICDACVSEAQRLIQSQG